MNTPHKITVEYSLPYYPTEGEGAFLMSFNMQETPESEPILFDVWVSQLSDAMSKAFKVEYEIVFISSIKNEPVRIRDFMRSDDYDEVGQYIKTLVIDRLLKCFYTAN